MTNDAPSGQETDGCTDLEITVCANGVINVHRPESDRAHSVFLDERGDVVRCSCKGHHYRGECVHADAIEEHPLVTASAQAQAASTPTVATDGGRVETDDGNESDLPAFEDIDDEPHRERCTGCGRTGPKGLGDDDPAILHEPDCPHDDRDDETERAACDECGATAETRFDADITHGRGCSQARGVVDPYADDHEEVDTTPL